MRWLEVPSSLVICEFEKNVRLTLGVSEARFFKGIQILIFQKKPEIWSFLGNLLILEGCQWTRIFKTLWGPIQAYLRAKFAFLSSGLISNSIHSSNFTDEITDSEKLMTYPTLPRNPYSFHAVTKELEKSRGNVWQLVRPLLSILNKLGLKWAMLLGNVDAEMI